MIQYESIVWVIMGRLVVSSEEGILVVLFWSWGILYGWCLIFKWLGLKIKVGHLHSSSINGHQGDMPYCTHFSQWLDAVRKIKDIGWCWLNKSLGIEFSPEVALISLKGAYLHYCYHDNYSWQLSRGLTRSALFGLVAQICAVKLGHRGCGYCVVTYFIVAKTFHQWNS